MKKYWTHENKKGKWTATYQKIHVGNKTERVFMLVSENGRMISLLVSWGWELVGDL